MDFCERDTGTLFFHAGSDTSSISSHSSTSRGIGGAAALGSVEVGGRSGARAYWKSFISGIQRVVLFTPFLETINRIKTLGSYSRPQLEVSLALSAVGLSLVDNSKKRELAYITITQCVTQSWPLSPYFMWEAISSLAHYS